MYGEGVLNPARWLQFLHCEYNYLPCPDDIYISRRRSGVLAAQRPRRQGQIRPLRETNAISRCCVEAIARGSDKMRGDHRGSDLLHPKAG
jgi:hypothetical protein